MAIYLSRKKGSGSATPITPSNSSPAQMTANTPVSPTANGYAIESYSSITPSNSSPVALTSGEIDKIGGNGYAIESYSSITPSSIDGPEAMTADSIYKPTVNSYAIDSYTTVVSSDSTPPNLTVGNMYRVQAQGGAGGYFYKTQASSITPSNASPVALTSGTKVNPSANGYAIESYSSLTPSNSTPATITSGDIYKASANGKAVASVTDVTPSSTPTSVSTDDIVKFGGSGKIVDDLTSITPSSTPTSVASGDNIHIGGSGVIVDSIPTPTSITPSNSSPVSLSTSSNYHPTANGYAIQSYDSVTPSGTPTSVSSGDIVKIGGSGVIVDFLPTIQSSKTVTATTSQQTVGPDTGYDAITEVVVDPQVHSEFYVPVQNEPYNDMGAQHNYRYVDTSGMVIPHPITPSNSNPVSIASGYPVEYTANGYAISSYSSITPSNSSPVSLSSGSIYKPSASGYAISSYSGKTPSDSSPASVSSGAIIKASSSGYLYASSGLLKGNFTLITAGYVTNSNNYYTYTFSQAITTCLVISFGDSGYSPMTYTGTGTVTNISTSTANPYFNSMKIKNVKSGDTIEIGKITISGNVRKMYAIFSIT